MRTGAVTTTWKFLWTWRLAATYPALVGASRILVVVTVAVGCGDNAMAPTAPDGARGVDAVPIVPAVPVAIVDAPPLPNWDGVYPWSVVVIGERLYYSDRVLGAGYVWTVHRDGGAVETAFPLSGSEAGAEYCLGGGGGENAGWLAARVGQVHWIGCMDRVRAVDAVSSAVRRIGTWDAVHVAATATHLYGTRAGAVVAFEVETATASIVATVGGSPAYVTVDDTHVYWSDVEGHVMRVARGGGQPVVLADSSWPHGLAIHDGDVYWADPAAGTIQRVPAAGGAVETIASAQDTPVGIEIAEPFVYWTNHPSLGPGAVMRAPLAGGDAVVVASGELDDGDEAWGPWDLAVDADAVYWTETYGRGAVMKIAR